VAAESEVVDVEWWCNASNGQGLEQWLYSTKERIDTEEGECGHYQG